MNGTRDTGPGQFCPAAYGQNRPGGQFRLISAPWTSKPCEFQHALPLFTSLLNTVCGYIPGGVLPYNHLIWSDSKEKLVELALQVLIVCLDMAPRSSEDTIYSDNLFLNYLSRLHRDEDFQYILQGITRLLMNPLQQTYLPYAHRKVYFHQELLIFFWKFCENNKKFLFYVLKSSDVLEILVPILHYLNDARADQSRVGLMHIGVFILLLLSGERNFGVRLNKPYTASVPMDIPVFSGSHADLLIIVFHKIITSGHQRLQPLFDCLLTVLCNVSPYIKTLSMVAACKIMHLVEAFSTPWFLLSTPTNHTLIYFLLEMLNNLIQYQFDGNSNLVYTIIRKRAVFHNLAHLPSDGGAISKAMKRKVKKPIQRKSSQNDESMEGSIPALPAEPGTLKASLIKFPGVESFTEAASAHPSQKQLEFLTQTVEALSVRKVSDPVMYPAQPLCPTSSHLVEDGGVHTVQALGGSGGSSLMDTKVVENLMDEDLGQRIESTASVQPKRKNSDKKRSGSTTSQPEDWAPTQEWINEWRKKLPLHTVMRLLQVLVPQVEKMCMDKGLTDESEILRFLQHGTLVGLLPVPHPILIRRYQANPGTAMWFRTYMWGVIYLRNIDPAVWFDTHIKLFQVQRI
ncbi:protein HID1 [Eurytemora carolleeae]|uniref:protein HID1 n=1 Tax=Eurytemora carolleeae TaxID=1294199 RepID=UPI000C75FD4A|nr:protein HID1 [Eurytemora carolleeae]|eukprot:XP_023321643.1 protein HID1-like [Eurytemora affinis]